MDTSKVRKIIITGANKGIGQAVAKLLYSEQDPYHIILTSRDIQRGQEAAKQIADSGSDSKSTIEVQQLDVNDSTSVDAFLAAVKDSHKEIDVLINNAGYNNKNASPEEAALILQTNFFSVVGLTEKMLPILAKDGKVIQVSSGYGGLNFQEQNVRDLVSVSSIRREDLMKLAEELREKTKEAKQTETGWNQQSYHNSKCLLNAYSRWVLPEVLKDDQQVYSFTPGHCKTDMGGWNAPITAEEGAKTAVFLVKLPFDKDETFNGKFFRNSALSSYD